MVKVLKLIKLVRLVRGSRIIQRWQTRVAISYANLTLAGVFFQVNTHIGRTIRLIVRRYLIAACLFSYEYI